MLFWAVLLGPLGIVAYRYRWARAVFLLLLAAVCFAAGGAAGYVIGVVLVLLAAIPALRSTVRR